jgi:hypothetical protein
MEHSELRERQGRKALSMGKENKWIIIIPHLKKFLTFLNEQTVFTSVELIYSYANYP